MNGERIAAILAALANPQRLRVVAALTAGRSYVSQLARDLSMSRPLLYMHLRRLEAAGLVEGHLELGDDGKAMKFYEVRPFDVRLTPELVVEAARTLASTGDSQASGEGAAR